MGATPALLPVEPPWQPSQLSATQNATASQVPSPSQGPAAAAALCELAGVGAVGPTPALLPVALPWQPSQLSATQGGELPSVEAAAGGGCSGGCCKSPRFPDPKRGAAAAQAVHGAARGD